MTRTALTFFWLCVAALQFPPTYSFAASGLTLPSRASEVHVLTGWRGAGPSGVVHYAAIRIRLADGWKTYWRAPGSSGFPPRIDWGSSTNLESAEILWPTPSIFDLNGIQTIGYEREVVIPVVVKPEQAGLPVHFQVNIDYGVCKDVCIPVSAQVQGLLRAITKPVDPAIQLATRRVPKIVNANDHEGVISCRIRAVAEKEFNISATIDVPERSFHNGVAVMELPNRLVWISDAETHRLDDGRLHVSAQLEFMEASPVFIDRSEIRVTLLSPPESTEFRGCLK